MNNTKKLVIQQGGIHRSLSKLTQSFNQHNAEWTKAERAIMNIPSHSTVFIGGFSNRLVPDRLVQILTRSNSRHLTVLTNVSVHNEALQALIAHSSKVKQLVTSLESNLDKSTSDVEVNLLDTVRFTNACSINGSGGEYALVRSECMDSYGRHYWNGPSLGNVLMATWAKFFSVAQFDNYVDKIPNNSIALNKIFVKYATQIDEKKIQNPTFTDDSKYETMVTRALLELKNNDAVMFSSKVYQTIRQFYPLKHINLNVLNDEIDHQWLLNLDWLALARKLDVCVVEIRGLNESGHMEFDPSSEADSRMRDVIVNLGPSTKIVALFREFEEEKTVRLRLKAVQKKPDLVIMEQGVFRWNQILSQFDLTESQENADFGFLRFKWFAKDSIFSMKSFYY